ncbi:hypothetical protein MIND_00560700 [Mycena indigotica]|uniref:Uncharacterized protein n=1 Tax=Mycena indigotica TaxID=2126181 RepID=A0A8H6SYG1_9AGAR|nr:uncharacterized protein MIND_00560700 [Mycena indigotica]KAF7307654.1 hypothetical protein MIND_00560700 [Mycena indigotica]
MTDSFRGGGLVMGRSAGGLRAGAGVGRMLRMGRTKTGLVKPAVGLSSTSYPVKYSQRVDEDVGGVLDRLPCLTPVDANEGNTVKVPGLRLSRRKDDDGDGTRCGACSSVWSFRQCARPTRKMTRVIIFRLHLLRGLRYLHTSLRAFRRQSFPMSVSGNMNWTLPSSFAASAQSHQKDHHTASRAALWTPHSLRQRHLH